MPDIQSKPNKKRRTVFSVLLIILASIGLCATGVIAKAVNDRSDYWEIFYWMDSDMLQRTEVSRYYRDMGWRHNEELYEISGQMTIAELATFASVTDLWMPNFRALKNGNGDKTIITADQINGFTEMLQFFASRGSPSLRDDINGEMERLRLPDFIGMTMTQAWVHVHAVWGDYDPKLATDFIYLEDPSIKPTPTPIPTRGPSSIRTPQGTLEGGGFANFWVEYRDPDDNYGFAYPADWVLSSQPDDANPDKGMSVCNNDLDNFYWGDPKGSCILILEKGGIDPDHPLDQAASEAICVYYMNQECGPITLIPENSGHPARVEVQFKVMYLDPPITAAAVVFRTVSGKLIIFYSTVPIMQTPEAQAIVDTFVLGDDTPIIAPAFEPSKKISVTETSP